MLESTGRVVFDGILARVDLAVRGDLVSGARLDEVFESGEGAVAERGDGDGVDAELGEQSPHGANVPHRGNVIQNQGFIGEE